MLVHSAVYAAGGFFLDHTRRVSLIHVGRLLRLKIPLKALSLFVRSLLWQRGFCFWNITTVSFNPASRLSPTIILIIILYLRSASLRYNLLANLSTSILHIDTAFFTTSYGSSSAIIFLYHRDLVPLWYINWRRHFIHFRLIGILSQCCLLIIFIT